MLCVVDVATDRMMKRSTSTPPSQVMALEPHLELVRALRARGASIQQIVLQLKRNGVIVHRTAVHRFCQKHGIPIGHSATRAPASK